MLFECIKLKMAAVGYDQITNKEIGTEKTM